VELLLLMMVVVVELWVLRVMWKRWRGLERVAGPRGGSEDMDLALVGVVSVVGVEIGVIWVGVVVEVSVEVILWVVIVEVVGVVGVEMVRKS